jgi:hypothetical protein
MTKTQSRSSAPAKKSGSAQPAPHRKPEDRKYAQRQAEKRRALLEERRRRNRKLAFASIAAVLAVVTALVAVKVAGGGGSAPASSSSSLASPAAGTAISAPLADKLTSIPLQTLATAPTNGVTTSPQPIGDPILKVDGKPDLLFVGAEFCPVCATERWAMYVALSKFGTFSPQPGVIHSAVRDGDISTVTFYKTTYSSPYLTFTPVETTTNQPTGNYYVPLQTLSPSQQRLWASHTSQSFPWLDFGGKMELTSAQYDPASLEGLTFKDIASVIGKNSTAIGADIDASANVLIKTICTTLTGNQPSAVCNAVGHG